MQIKSVVKQLLLTTKLCSDRRFCGAVLAYHRVSLEEPNPDLPLSVLEISRRKFFDHIKLLSERCRVVPLREILSAASSWKGGDRPPVAITFDDGYRDNVTLALPILKQLSVPATIFVCTGMSAGRVRPWWYDLWEAISGLPRVSGTWRARSFDLPCTTALERKRAFLLLHGIMRRLTVSEQQRFLEVVVHYTRSDPHPDILSTTELKELADEPLISLAAHSDTHPVSRLSTDDELADDLRYCAEQLSLLSSSIPEHFAFPYGSIEDADTREADVARGAFPVTWSSRYGLLTAQALHHRRLLPRVIVERDDGALHLEWKLRALW